jgi:hypothetical protein
VSRVYTEKVIVDVAAGTASYIFQFYSALASTRLPPEIDPSFGGSVLDYFLVVYGTSDPFLVEELAITESWSQWDEWRDVDSELHQIPGSFKEDWPPPQAWAQSVDWNPLSQSSGRRRLHCVNIRTRK